MFEALADPATWFIIDPSLVDVNPRERLALGTTGTMRNRRGPGLTATATWTTTELIPGARLVQRLKGFGYELTESVTLAVDTLGTQVTVVDSVIPTSLAGRLAAASAARRLGGRNTGDRRGSPSLPPALRDGAD